MSAAGMLEDLRDFVHPDDALSIYDRLYKATRPGFGSASPDSVGAERVRETAS
jgi:hypothetical protein